MKTLYLECNMGAAGDMLMAALLELHDEPGDFLRRLNAVGLLDVEVTVEPAVKCGIVGTKVRVVVGGHEEGHDHHDHSHDHHDHDHDHHDHDHDHDHHDHDHHDHDHHNHDHHHDHSHDHHDHNKDHSHNTYHHIEHTIHHLAIPDPVKSDALAVYKLIAEAESRAHGIPLDQMNQIHFHEVGELDAVADIVGVCMLIHELSPDIILASPVNVGSGHVRCSHGILPVPAPATAFIMKGTPIYNDDIRGELLTPTGAALLKHFAKDFTAMPTITVDRIGYGMGTKEFKKANCVRAFLGQTDHAPAKVTELVCNLDDMTPEAVSFALQLLIDEGALDVYTTPIVMKKGRAGVSLTCMCRVDDRDKMMGLIFKHTTTLGMREYVSRRYALQKEHHEIDTAYGKVRAKTSSGFGVSKTKAEFDDIAEIARREGISISDVISVG